MTTPEEEEEAKLRQTYSEMSNAELEEILERGVPRLPHLVINTMLQERRERPVEEQTGLMRETNDLAKKSMSVSEESINIARRAEARTESIYTLMIWAFGVSVLAVGVAVLALVVSLR